MSHPTHAEGLVNKYIYTQYFHIGRMLYKVNFLADLNRMEFRVFFERAQFTRPFTHNWRKNNCIHNFLNGFSAM